MNSDFIYVAKIYILHLKGLSGRCEKAGETGSQTTSELIFAETTYWFRSSTLGYYLGKDRET